jgi:glucose 1-dehydrogenase
VKGNVSRKTDVDDMLSRFIEAFGRLDILVANAGLQRDAPVTDMTLEQWQEFMDVNLTGQFLCARGAIKQFLTQGMSPASVARGKIICMSAGRER